jgi:DNA polymerase III sliding clamp (beta) subunit (PCNA family)
MKITFLKPQEFKTALKFCETAQSKEAARYYLQGICLDWDGKELVAVATNAHTLLAYTFQNVEVEGEPEKVIISTADIKVLLMCDITSIDSEGNVINGPNIKFIDGNFPDWRRVLPGKSEAQETVRINHKYLTDMGKAAKALDKKTYRMTFAPDYGPVSIDFGLPNALGVIMPMKV